MASETAIRRGCMTGWNGTMNSSMISKANSTTPTAMAPIQGQRYPTASSMGDTQGHTHLTKRPTTVTDEARAMPRRNNPGQK